MLSSLLPNKIYTNTCTCPVCKKEFTPKTYNQKFCSVECRREDYKPTQKKYNKDSIKKTPPYKTPEFIGIDGEAIKDGEFNWVYEEDGKKVTKVIPQSHYVMLQADGIEPLYAECIKDATKKVESLTSTEIFEWLLQPALIGKDIIGYFLNYDFENWLRDVPDNLYCELLEAKEVTWGLYTIWFIPKKIFKVSRPDKDNLEKILSRTIYDYSGYWQRAFLKTVKANKECCTPEEYELLVNGKANRNIFKREDWKEIAEYNQLECVVLSKIAKKSFDTIADGFAKADIKIKPKGKDSYSPKALASKFYKLLKWRENHPILKIDDVNIDKFSATLGSYSNERTLAFPFSAAYYGGRIESLQIGEFSGELYSSDIRSAYPRGLSTLPEKWDSTDAIYTEKDVDIARYVSERYCGMYLINWNFPDNWTLYPFPFRSSFGNVYFPARGKGWVSCLEYYAVLDTVPANERKHIDVSACMVLKNTANRGAVHFNRTNDAWENGFNARQGMKKRKESGEYGIKLLLNAGYGGTIQQVGVKDWRDEKTLKVFNDFVGMWITAYCRATVWLGVCEYRTDKDAIIAIQTDGVYSTKPLHVNSEPFLGCWEVDKIYDMTNIMSGIYTYYDNPDKTGLTQKQRGWGSLFNFGTAIDVLYGRLKSYTVEQEAFIPRGFALHQKNRLAGCALQWIPIKKDFIPTLESKRESPKKIVLKSKYKYFKPKPNVSMMLGADISKPFELKFSDTNHLDSTNKPDFILEHVEGNENYHAGIQE